MQDDILTIEYVCDNLPLELALSEGALPFGKSTLFPRSTFLLG